jgi:hypothetical protein
MKKFRFYPCEKGDRVLRLGLSAIGYSGLTSESDS